MQNQFEAMSVDELLEVYVGVLRELMRRETIRTNNLVAEIGEKVVADCLNLVRAKNSTKGYDAIDPEGVRYQIKTRHVSSHNKSKQLGDISIEHVTEQRFDYLIGVLLNENFTVRQVVKVLPALIPKYAGTKDGAYRLSVTRYLLADPQVQDITGLFIGNTGVSL